MHFVSEIAQKQQNGKTQCRIQITASCIIMFLLSENIINVPCGKWAG